VNAGHWSSATPIMRGLPNCFRISGWIPYNEFNPSDIETLKPSAKVIEE